MGKEHLPFLGQLSFRRCYHDAIKPLQNTLRVNIKILLLKLMFSIQYRFQVSRYGICSCEWKEHWANPDLTSCGACRLRCRSSIHLLRMQEQLHLKTSLPWLLLQVCTTVHNMTHHPLCHYSCHWESTAVMLL